MRTTKEELTVASLTTSGVEADALNCGTVPNSVNRSSGKQSLNSSLEISKPSDQ